MNNDLSIERGYFADPRRTRNLMSQEQAPKAKRSGANTRDAVVKAYHRLASGGTPPTLREVTTASGFGFSTVFIHLKAAGLPYRPGPKGPHAGSRKDPLSSEAAMVALAEAAMVALADAARAKTRAERAASQAPKPTLTVAAKAKRDYFRAWRNISTNSRTNTHAESPEASQPA